MKKTYYKPMLLLERFDLTCQLSSCVTIISHNDSACVKNDPDSSHTMKDFARWGYFLGGCDRQRTGVDFEDGICYHTSSNLVFTS